MPTMPSIDQILQRRREHGVKKRDKEAEAISKEISRAVAKGLRGCEDDDESESASESDSDNSSDDDETDTLSNLPACLLAIKVAKDDMLTLIGANPCRGDISIIVNSIGEIEKLLKRVIRAQDKILNFCGISPEWHAADTVS
ncbi:hypothetical protein DEU56DRAFT_910477 [Suillus clintonianus]|uniref:uncharacterized protein n=1 Tax=Suillus clintonianus TaxID=1904413 RepID=UPI001B87F829|nr:uncharacterized protein DEU56DRAFT_910477 [Suillus clintonianus]KAG2144546.1 hypothetical protein DEU56DRAFT_910477 [Suillus clintonianus]